MYEQESNISEKTSHQGENRDCDEDESEEEKGDKNEKIDEHGLLKEKLAMQKAQIRIRKLYNKFRVIDNDEIQKMLEDQRSKGQILPSREEA